MVEDIKGLIEKIQREGIKAAEDKAKAIEDDAKQRAQAIIEEAKRNAERIIAEAKEENVRIEESSNISLKQTGRDLLLTLKKEINAMLDKLITARVGEALNPHELAKIITILIKDYNVRGKEGITILLNKEDLNKLEKGLLSELRDEIKKGIRLKPSEDISKGFIISYDGGKSHFDFTDKALAEYIGSYLKPKLQGLLEGTR